MNGVSNSQFDLKKIEELLVQPPQYGANEKAISVENDDYVRYIRITDINDDGLLIDDDIKTAEKIEDKYALEHNDILLARSGNTAGKSFIFDKNMHPSIFAGYLIRFKINEAVVLPKYVFYYTQLKPFKQWVESTKRAAGQPNINAQEYKSLEIPVPPENIQKDIVAILNKAYQSKALKLQQAQELVDDIDTFIYNSLDLKEPVQKEDSINNRVFKVHLAPAFTDRLDPHFYKPEFEENDDLIRTLNHKKLKDIISFSNESWNQKDYFTDTFPYIEISEINLLTGEINNVVETPIDNAASRAKMIVRENDIIVSTTRPHRGAITKITKENDFSIASTGFAVLRDIKIKDLDKDYLLYILRSELVKKQLLQRSSGGNYPAITLGELKKVIIPIPDIQIQKKIVAEVEKRISTHKRLLREAEAEFLQAKHQVEQIILCR